MGIGKGRPSRDRTGRRAAASGRPGRKRDIPSRFEDLPQDALLHELQVHSIELEVQNESLLRLRTELEESRNRYRDLFDSAPVGYLTLDRWARIRDVNLAGSTLLGEEPGRLVGSGFGRFVAEQDLPTWDLHFRMVLREGARAACTLLMRRPGGSDLTAHLESTRIGTREGEYLVRTIISDVSEHEKMDREREGLISELDMKNRELDQFASTVAHGLRSALTTLRGYLSLAEEDAHARRTDRLTDEIVKISAAAKRMQEILDSLLQLSRIGRIVNPAEEIPFGNLVEEALELVAIPIRERGVRISLGPDLPRIYGDRVRLRDVLVNLIENGVKFMGDQENPVVEIGAVTVSGTPAYFVRDNGMGISEGDQAKVFDLFRKLDGRSPGYGLGLALAKRIVDVHGGRIWIESAGPGRGSTFWFTVPPPPARTAGDA